MSTSSTHRTYNALPLDLPLQITKEEQEFFTLVTGIKDWTACTAHITEVQGEAYSQICSYPCIRSFNFCRFKVASHFDYPKVRALGQAAEESPVFLDVGCCFGTDVRKVGVDGWNSKNILGVELQKGFVDLGYKLFLDTPTSCPISFLVGDIFEPSFYTPSASAGSSPPDLSSLTSLSPLHGKVSAIHAGSLFHLFDESTQKKLAGIFFSLMDQSKGSVIFGSHVGIAEKGYRKNKAVGGTDQEGKAEEMFCHDPTSWEAMWWDVAGDKVKVDARLMGKGESRISLAGPENTGAVILMWSVTLV